MDNASILAAIPICDPQGFSDYVVAQRLDTITSYEFQREYVKRFYPKRYLPSEDISKYVGREHEFLININSLKFFLKDFKNITYEETFFKAMQLFRSHDMIMDGDFIIGYNTNTAYCLMTPRAFHSLTLTIDPDSIDSSNRMVFQYIQMNTNIHKIHSFIQSLIHKRIKISLMQARKDDINITGASNITNNEINSYKNNADAFLREISSLSNRLNHLGRVKRETSPIRGCVADN